MEKTSGNSGLNMMVGLEIMSGKYFMRTFVNWPIFYPFGHFHSNCIFYILFKITMVSLRQGEATFVVLEISNTLIGLI